MDIVCNNVYQQHSPPIYSKETFKKLLQIATGGYFVHRGKLYCQIDGVTMGSPLGPTLAIFYGSFRKSVNGSARCIYACTLL